MAQANDSDITVRNVIQFVPRERGPTMAERFPLPTKPSAERRLRWYEAQALVDYYDAQRALLGAVFRLRHHNEFEAEANRAGPDAWSDIIQKERAARAKLLLTPVYNRAGLDWKRKQVSSDRLHLVPVTHERLAQVIEEDEEFLSSRMAKRKNRSI